MRLPNRKPSKFSNLPHDPLMTEDKFLELNKKLSHLKKIQPQAAAEVSRLAEMGDFSENAEYQLAKGRLRGINNRILVLEHQLNQATIIAPNKQTEIVELGHAVTVEVNGQEKTYKILGSTETDPTHGVISHTSPLGAALLGHRVGDVVTVQLAHKRVDYKIVHIEFSYN